MSSWKEMLAKEMQKNGESLDELIRITISEEEMDRELDNGRGSEDGEPFTAWGPNFVYFPVCYDGEEWVGSVPRDPCDISTLHQGGG